jgi:hypothetical protein
MGYPRDIPRNILPPDYAIIYIASGIKRTKRRQGGESWKGIVPVRKRSNLGMTR